MNLAGLARTVISLRPVFFIYSVDATFSDRGHAALRDIYDTHLCRQRTLVPLPLADVVAVDDKKLQLVLGTNYTLLEGSIWTYRDSVMADSDSSDRRNTVCRPGFLSNPATNHSAYFNSYLSTTLLINQLLWFRCHRQLYQTMSPLHDSLSNFIQPQSRIKSHRE